VCTTLCPISFGGRNVERFLCFYAFPFVSHQVITAYTVRAKQGKAQLHYLRQGGPGRMSVGGGIRARETARLFSRICEVLNMFIDLDIFKLLWP
jgi:hypothetical protein